VCVCVCVCVCDWISNVSNIMCVRVRVYMCVSVCVCARQIQTHMSTLPIHSEQNCQELKPDRRREILLIWILHASVLSTQTNHGRGGERKRERDITRESWWARKRASKGKKGRARDTAQVKRYTYIYTYICVCIHTHTHTHINMHIHTHTHTHAHTRTHTHTYVQRGGNERCRPGFA